MPDGRFLSKSVAHDWDLNTVSFKSDYIFMRCIPHLDREGRIPAHPGQVKAMVAPIRKEVTPEDIDQAFSELAARGMIEWYEVEGRPFAQFPGFERHQKGLRKDREAASDCPAPSEGVAITGVIGAETNMHVENPVPGGHQPSQVSVPQGHTGSGADKSSAEVDDACGKPGGDRCADASHPEHRPTQVIEPEGLSESTPEDSGSTPENSAQVKLSEVKGSEVKGSEVKGSQGKGTHTVDAGKPHPPRERWPAKPPKNDSGHYDYPDPFEKAWDEYPARDGSNPKAGAYRAFRARVVDGEDPAALVIAATHYRQHLAVRGQEGSRFVQQASTFYGPSEPFREFVEPGKNGPPLSDADREMVAGIERLKDVDLERSFR